MSNLLSWPMLAVEYMTNTKHGGLEDAWLGVVSRNALRTAADI